MSALDGQKEHEQQHRAQPEPYERRARAERERVAAWRVPAE
jgi:hypothetical protein